MGIFSRRDPKTAASTPEAERVAVHGVREIDDVGHDVFGCPTSDMYRHHDPDFKQENVKGREVLKQFAKLYGITLNHVD